MDGSDREPETQLSRPDSGFEFFNREFAATILKSGNLLELLDDPRGTSPAATPTPTPARSAAVPSSSPDELVGISVENTGPAVLHDGGSAATEKIAIPEWIDTMMLDAPSLSDHKSEESVGMLDKVAARQKIVDILVRGLEEYLTPDQSAQFRHYLSAGDHGVANILDVFMDVQEPDSWGCV